MYYYNVFFYISNFFSWVAHNRSYNSFIKTCVYLCLSKINWTSFLKYIPLAYYNFYFSISGKSYKISPKKLTYIVTIKKINTSNKEIFFVPETAIRTTFLSIIY